MSGLGVQLGVPEELGTLGGPIAVVHLGVGTFDLKAPLDPALTVDAPGPTLALKKDGRNSQSRGRRGIAPCTLQGVWGGRDGGVQHTAPSDPMVTRTGGALI